LKEEEVAMIRRTLAGVAVMALAIAGNAAAHEGHKHKTHKMMGTVKAVHADMNHVEITTVKGATSGFYVDAKTKYLRGSTKLTLADLKPGTRVVIDAKAEGEKMTAVQVKVSAAPAQR
jgi:hypothetical protein